MNTMNTMNTWYSMYQIEPFRFGSSLNVLRIDSSSRFKAQFSLLISSLTFVIINEIMFRKSVIVFQLIKAAESRSSCWAAYLCIYGVAIVCTVGITMITQMSSSAARASSARRLCWAEKQSLPKMMVHNRNDYASPKNQLNNDSECL